MTESKTTLVKTIESIRENKNDINIPGFSAYATNGTFSNNLDELLRNIKYKEELEAFPDFVGKYIKPEHLEILLNKKITDLDVNTKNALNYLPENFLNKISENTFLGISNECLKSITPEQCAKISQNYSQQSITITQQYNDIDLTTQSEDIFMQLVRDNRLQYLSDESIMSVSKKLDLGHKSQFNIFSYKLTENELKTQLDSLFKSGKLQYLSEKAVETIDPEFIVTLPNDYLSCLAKCGLTSKQTSYLSEEQFKSIFNENKDNIKPKMIAGLKINTILKNDNFLKNLTLKQAKSLTKEQAKAIQENGKFDILPDNVLYCVANKTEKGLEGLDEKTLIRIGECKRKNVPTLGSEQQLANFNLTISFKGTVKANKENFKSAIKNYTKKEEWLKLEKYCFFQSEDVERKSLIYNTLIEEAESKEYNIYALADKIRLLLVIISLTPDSNKLINDYKKFEETLIAFINETPNTIDEYLTKSDLYSSLINNDSLDIKLRQILCEEQIMLMEEDFVKKFCGKSGYSNLVNEEISNAYLNKANLLLKVEGEDKKVDTKKFTKKLSNNDDFDLNATEIQYRECLEKIHEYTPVLENAIRFYTAAGTRLIAKAAATFFGAKVATNTKSRALSIGAAIGTVAMGVNTVGDARNVTEQTITSFNKEEKHKEERKEKIEYSKGIIGNVTDTIDNAANYVMGNYVFKTKRNSISKIEKLSKTQNNRAETYKKESIIEGIKNQLITFDEDSKNKENEMLEILTKGENEKSKQKKLIEDDIKIRTEALKLAANRKVENLLTEFPEFLKDDGIKGFFSNLLYIGKSAINGVVSGILDTASLGRGGKIYKQLTDKKNDDEKVIIESKLIAFQEGTKIINDWLTNELNNLDHEKCRRLASLNKLDKEKFDEFEKNIKSIKLQIENKKEIFGLKEEKSKEKTEEKSPAKNEAKTIELEEKLEEKTKNLKQEESKERSEKKLEEKSLSNDSKIIEIPESEITEWKLIDISDGGFDLPDDDYGFSEDELGDDFDQQNNAYSNQTNKDVFEQVTERTTTELNIEENNNRNYHREQLEQQPEREGCDILLK